MLDYSEETKQANRVEAINKINALANTVMPELIAAYAELPPQQLASELGFYQATKKTFHSVMNNYMGNYALHEITYFMRQRWHSTNLCLRTSYEVSETGCAYIEFEETIFSTEHKAFFEPRKIITVSRVTYAAKRIEEEQTKIALAEQSINDWKATVYPYFS